MFEKSFLIEIIGKSSNFLSIFAQFVPKRSIRRKAWAARSVRILFFCLCHGGSWEFFCKFAANIEDDETLDVDSDGWCVAAGRLW
jgi:hypothetical protein